MGENSKRSDVLPNIELDVRVDLRKAVFGGVLGMLVSFFGAWAVGRVHGAEGIVLLEAMLPTTRFLCSAVMTASATILALMLTLLGLSTEASKSIQPGHYKRVWQIALIDTIGFVAATLLLLLLNVPVEESESIASPWFARFYYAILVFSSLLGGLLIAVVLMLYDAVRDMIQAVGLEREDHPILETEEEPDE